MASETIPKVIHYCWFGGNPLGEEELACIKSWQKYMPDYAIARWDETNFDVHGIRYCEQAYEAKLWAFVSDYARFAILYEHGGVYFDTDVELIKPIDDILARGPFMGCGTDGTGATNSCAVASGLGLAAYPGLDLYESILEYYKHCDLIKPDGSYDMTSVVERTNSILREHGLDDSIGIQEVAGVVIYPAEYFNPMDFLTGTITITPNTRSIHHYSMSWYEESRKTQVRIQRALISAGLSKLIADPIARFLGILRHGDYNRLIRKTRTVISEKLRKS